MSAVPKHLDPTTGSTGTPYTMQLRDGRKLHVEIPPEWTTLNAGGELLIKPKGVRLLDQLRALSMIIDRPPTPGHIRALRDALNLTQAELGRKLGVNKLTVSRWECGSLKPGKASIEAIERLRRNSARRGVILPGPNG